LREKSVVLTQVGPPPNEAVSPAAIPPTGVPYFAVELTPRRPPDRKLDSPGERAAKPFSIEPSFIGANHVGGISERHKEINRRRQRRKKLAHFKRKLDTATVSEKKDMAGKLRLLTPGAEAIITNWALEER
jgi:hypothetical protein